MIETKLKKDDQVMVISGREKGKTGRILQIDKERGRVIVEGLNMKKKTMKPRNEQDKGGITEIEGSIHISNVMLVTKKGEKTRAGYSVVEGKKVRIAKKTGEKI